MHSYDSLFHDIPNNDLILCTRAGEQVGVMWMPDDGRNCLLVFRHDGEESELIVLPVQLKNNETLTVARLRREFGDE